MSVKSISFVKKHWLLFILISICVAQGLIFGVQDYHPDCKAYILKYSSVSPLYPMFLGINRFLFNEKYFLAVLIEQNILLACSLYALYDSMKKCMKIYGTVLSSVVVFLLLLPYVVTPLVTRSHMIVSNSILTEGLSFPLYNFFVASLITCCKEKKWKSFWLCGILCMLILPLRTQLIFVMVILGIVYLFLVYSTRTKRWFFHGLVFPVCFVVLVLCSKIYSVMNTTQYVHYGSNFVWAIRGMYYSNESDVDFFSSEDTKKVFLESVTQMKRNNLCYDESVDSFICRVDNQERSFDAIGQIIDTNVYSFSASKMDRDSEDFLQHGKKICEELAHVLIKKTWKSQISYYLGFVVQGFVRTISIWNLPFFVLSICLYFLFFVVFFVQAVVRRNKPLTMMFMIVTLLIVGNVFSTSLAIMCLSRYMIYNMSLFYITLLVGLCDAWKNRKTMKPYID